MRLKRLFLKGLFAVLLAVLIGAMFVLPFAYAIVVVEDPPEEEVAEGAIAGHTTTTGEILSEYEPSLGGEKGSLDNPSSALPGFEGPANSEELLGQFE